MNTEVNIEQRFLRRIKLGPADNLKARFTTPDATEHLTKVFDITSLGCRILTEHKITHKKLLSFELLMNNGSAGEYKHAQIVSENFNENNLYEYGINFESHHLIYKVNDSRRELDRHTVNKNIQPHGYFDNPNKINERITFSLLDISKNGFSFETSPRNKYLFPSDKIIKFYVTFPFEEKSLEVSGSIRHISKNNENSKLNVGVKLSKPNELFNIAAGNYFIGFLKTNCAKEFLLKDFSFGKKLKKYFSYSICETEDEYSQVRELRKISYEKEGKLINDKSTDSDFDAKSFIVIVKSGQKVIASVRLSHRKICNKFELDDFVHLPDWLKKENVVEASRACVAPHFQRSNLVHGMFEYLSILCLQLKAQYIVTSCEDKNLKLYKYLGFKKAGLTYNFTKFKAKPHHVIFGNLDAIKFAKGMNPIYWHYTYGEVIKYLDKFGLTDSTKVALWKKFVIYFLKKIKK